MSDSEHQPIEHRNAGVEIVDVNYSQRIIDMLAVPWEEEAPVTYKGRAWREVFERGAFDGLEKRPGRVRIRRDHDEQRTVGKMITARNSARGLVTSSKIAPTILGDETLGLAADDCLAPSVGFAPLGADGQRLILHPTTPPQSNRVMDQLPLEVRAAMGIRRIVRAFLDHISLEPDQAYDGARVLSVRSAIGVPELPAVERPVVVTPTLDEWSSYLHARRVKVRV